MTYGAFVIGYGYFLYAINPVQATDAKNNFCRRLALPIALICSRGTMSLPGCDYR